MLEYWNFWQRKIDDEVSLETKIAIRQMRGRSASVTEDDERITFSWENVTVQEGNSIA